MTQGWAVATGRHNRVTWGRRKRRIICPSSVHCSSLICLLARPDRCAPFSCAQCDVSFSASLFLALMNLFFPPPTPPSTILCPAPDSLCPTAATSWTTCPSLAHCGPSRFRLLPLFMSPFVFFFSDRSPAPTQKKKKFLKTHRVCAGPFRLEIIECTVAPVAMEDSDHEVQSSSDERDSCPASPNRGRDHDADQVLATSLHSSSTQRHRALLLGYLTILPQLMGAAQLIPHYFYSLLGITALFIVQEAEVEKTQLA